MPETRNFIIKITNDKRTDTKFFGILINLFIVHRVIGAFFQSVVICLDVVGKFVV